MDYLAEYAGMNLEGILAVADLAFIVAFVWVVCRQVGTGVTVGATSEGAPQAESGRARR